MDKTELSTKLDDVLTALDMVYYTWRINQLNTHKDVLSALDGNHEYVKTYVQSLINGDEESVLK